MTLGHLNGGVMLTGVSGKYDQAIADFTKVIQARPKDVEAYRRRGLTYYR